MFFLDFSLYRTCGMFLRRYAIVFRELLTRESILPKWRELLMILSGLKTAGRLGAAGSSAAFWESSSRCQWRPSLCAPCATSSHPARRYLSRRRDPMNLVGIVVPGERVPANSGKVVAFRGGVAVPNGERAAVIRMTATG